MTQRLLDGINELGSILGQKLGPSDWLEVTQEKIDSFAVTTGDDQWIHVDPERAALGPYGTTVAHGYLTLSLLPVLVRDIYRINGVRSVINMGNDRVRFPAAVPAGARIRATVELKSLTEAPNGFRLHGHAEVECDRTDRPVCVAETVSLIIG